MKFITLIFCLLLCVVSFAETDLTVTTMSETAVVIPYEAVDTDNGNEATNINGDIFFLLHNSHGSDSATITFTAQQTTKDVAGYGPLTKADLVVALTFGQRKMVGPFRSSAWNDSSGDVILAITGDASGSVNAAALRIPQQ